MSRVFQCKKRAVIWTRVMLFKLECLSCKNMYVMKGCRGGTGAAGTICSEPKSESDSKSGAATAPRKVVSNSYQTYRTASGMKWTNFRLRLLWISRSSRHHPEKGDSILFITVNAYLEHSIWFPCDRITQLASFDKKSSSSRMGYRSYTCLTCIWRAGFLNSRSK